MDLVRHISQNPNSHLYCFHLYLFVVLFLVFNVRLVGATPWRIATYTYGYPARTQFPALAFDSKIFILGGTSGSNYTTNTTNSILWSTDGANWVQLNTTSSIWPPLAGHAAVVLPGNMVLVTGGQGPEGFSTKSWLSGILDLTTWTQIGSGIPWTGRRKHAMFILNSKVWIVAGQDATLFYHDVYSSSDGGVSWIMETAAAEFSARSSHRVVVKGAVAYLIAGYDGTTYYDDIWNTTDGVHWVLMSTASYPARSDHGATLYNDHLWFCGGFRTSVIATCYSSMDGWTWQAQASMPGGKVEMTLVNYNNRLFALTSYGSTRVYVYG